MYLHSSWHLFYLHSCFSFSFWKHLAYWIDTYRRIYWLRSMQASLILTSRLASWKQIACRWSTIFFSHFFPAKKSACFFIRYSTVYRFLCCSKFRVLKFFLILLCYYLLFFYCCSSMWSDAAPFYLSRHVFYFVWHWPGHPLTTIWPHKEVTSARYVPK